MKFFRVVAGARKHWSFRVAWTGRFRSEPDRPWMPVEALQYDLRRPVARLPRADSFAVDVEPEPFRRKHA